MRISLLLFIPPLLTASLSLPDNALEGFSIHLEDEAGNVTYVHESDFEAHGIFTTVLDTNPANSTDPPSLIRRALPPGDYINCEEKKTFNVADLHTGMVNLADQLGCSYIINTFKGARWKFVAANYYAGNSVIYICNYSNQDRTLQGAQLVDFLSEVFSFCGKKNIAGWYYDKFLNMSWGYTGSTHGYCEPGSG